MSSCAWKLSSVPGRFDLQQSLFSPDSVQLAVVSVDAEVAEVGGSGGARDGQGRNG